MGPFFNQNSFLVTVVFLWLIAGGIFLRGERGPRAIAIFAGVTILLTAGFFLFRLEPGTRDLAAEIKAQIGAGKPVLLEFRSQN
jgi:hypothetical protein